jgi:hypothetical protein
MKGIVVPLAAFLLSLAVLRLSSGQASAAAFKEGPYPNVTGGFGEQSCRLCHLDNPLNAPGGQLTLAGVPPSFTPGSVYPITVTIAREDMRRGGFEIAARFAGGKQKGRQAGTWKLTDARTQLIPGAVDKALTFVQHNLAGSRAATAGANTWTIEWTAPADASAPVQFNVAANASNNDDSPLGDYIYLQSARSLPARLKPRAPSDSREHP